MTPSLGEPPILAVHDVHKVYPSGTHALRGVTMVVRPGSVHGLIGANGAGKSTLIKILCGAETVTRGRVLWETSEVSWTTPGQAREAGLATVHQHTPLVPSMTILENIYLGSTASLIWDAGARQIELERLCDRIGYNLDPQQLVSELSVGGRQMIAIIQALARDPTLVLLDEPTAALSTTERDILFRVIRRLSGQGTTFVYVSHFLDEVLDLTDHLTVLRDGSVVADQATADTTKTDLVAAIVGDRLARAEAQRAVEGNASAESLLEVRGLRSPGRFGPIDLSVHAGEVVGIAGMLGAGRTELLEAIFGADRSALGDVSVGGKQLRRWSSNLAVRIGLALVPEDRNRQGLIRDWSIQDNISLPYLSSHSRLGLFPREIDEERLSERAIDELAVKTDSGATLVGELSGGNAQKVVFGKWLYGPAKVFLLDEPAAGVDVGAKADIVQLIRQLAADDKGVLIVASEFEELLGVCDRILVMRRGEIIGDYPAASTDLHQLTALASGLEKVELQQ
jgi:ribose transport system ATP-binding protein